MKKTAQEFHPCPAGKPKEWYKLWRACLKEFQPWEFGPEAYKLAEIAADNLYKEDQDSKEQGRSSGAAGPSQP